MEGNEDQKNLSPTKNEDEVEQKMDLIEFGDKEIQQERDLSAKETLNSPNISPIGLPKTPIRENFSFDRDLFLSNHIRTEKSENENKKPKEVVKETPKPVQNVKPIQSQKKNTAKDNDNWSERSSARDTEREVIKNDNDHVKTLLQGYKN